MVHFCIFGGHAVDLGPGARVLITFCGGCEVQRPTIAKQLIELRKRGQKGVPSRRLFCLTVMGATEIKVPTLAEEFVQLQEALRSGALTQTDVEQGLAELAASDSVQVTSFTAMGGFEDGTPPGEDEEIDRLAMHHQLGTISSRAAQILLPAAGKRGSDRPAIIRQAVAAVA